MVLASDQRIRKGISRTDMMETPEQAIIAGVSINSRGIGITWESYWGGCLLRTRRAIYLVEGPRRRDDGATTTGNPGNVE